MNRPILGLKRNEVKLVKHDPLWADEFLQVKQSIRQAIPEFLEQQIQHIGSTAILDIQAKPIIDIAIGIDWTTDDLERYNNPLQKLGFYRLKVERENEIVFARFTDSTFEVKTHFIHMIPYNGEKWRNMIFFRDYLNKNSSIRMEYEQLKTSFDINHGGIQEYTSYKEQWVQEIFAKRTKNM